MTRPGVASAQQPLFEGTRLLTAKEVAAKLSLSEKTLYGYVARDLIPHVKIQSSVRFVPEVITEWLAKRRAGTPVLRDTRRARGAKRGSRRPQQKITERDIEVLNRLGNHRYLSTSQVQRLLFPSSRTATRRLEFLARQLLVGRISPPSTPGHGKSEFVYFLRPAAAEFVASSARFSTLWRPGRGTGLRSLAYLQHFLRVNDFWIALEQACPESDVRLTNFVIYDPRSDTCPGLEASAIRPDAYFTLEGRIGKRALFFVEVDQGTEKISSQKYYSFETKVINYLSYLGEARFREFGEFSGFRVLVVCPTSRRVEALRRCVLERGVQKLLWFTTSAETQTKNVLLAPIWRLPPTDTPKMTLITPPEQQKEARHE